MPPECGVVAACRNRGHGVFKSMEWHALGTAFSPLFRRSSHVVNPRLQCYMPWLNGRVKAAVCCSVTPPVMSPVHPYACLRAWGSAGWNSSSAVGGVQMPAALGGKGEGEDGSGGEVSRWWRGTGGNCRAEGVAANPSQQTSTVHAVGVGGGRSVPARRHKQGAGAAVPRLTKRHPMGEGESRNA